MADWHSYTDFESVCKRAGGRRHYNSWRQFKAWHRRGQVLELLNQQRAIFQYGSHKRIARQLGVSEATISRDIMALLKLTWPCPTCGYLRLRKEAENKETFL